MTSVKLSGKLLSIVIVCGSVSALAQTQVDLQAQSRQVNFSAAASTKPMKTGATLPATCSTGELFFNTSSPAGSNVYGCVFTDSWALQETLPTPGATGAVLAMGASSTTWVPLGGDVTGAPGTVTVRSLQNRPISISVPQAGQALVWSGSTWEPQTVVTGQGTVHLEADGTLVGTRGAVNFVSGFGLLNTFADTGTRLDVQQNVDTAVIETRANQQTGASLLCASGGASATTYTCAMSPTLATYTTGMVLRWKPDVSATGGATTLNVDSLGTKSVKLSDGATDPRAGDLVAGGLYNLWYDGANFRVMFSPGVGESTPASRPTCDATRRGRLWMSLEASGAKDELAVCAKAADDTYAWRVLY